MRQWMLIPVIASLSLLNSSFAQTKVGVNTNAPTATLDVNGNVRVRGDFPAKSATVVSKDANGTATWQKVTAFRVTGESTGSGFSTSNGYSFFKFDFGSIPEYNIGFAYSANASTFTVPVKGIYHFDVSITSYKKDGNTNVHADGPVVQLMRTRGTTKTSIDQSHFGLSLNNAGTMWGPEVNNRMCGDFMLEAGDEIWVSFQSTYATLIYGDTFKHSFCGHLVHQIF